MTYQVRINKDWRTTLPLGLRKEMNIKPGDAFKWKVVSQNAVLIQRLRKESK